MRLLELQRQVRELKEEFAPPPSPPDSAHALIADLWSAWILIVLHSHGWRNSSDGLEEIVRLLGIPEIIEWNVNLPGVEDALCKLCRERILLKLRTIVDGRGGKWPDDETIVFINDDLESLCSDIPVELKEKDRLPSEYLEFYSRAEALFGKI
jgi:hypothetical protein